MKKRVLLVDESLTVQKVVALTLDKSRYLLSFAKSRADVMKLVVEATPDLILVSDQVADINIGSFPKEVEAWLAGKPAPPVILISGGDVKEQKHYAGVLRKPFAPHALQSMVIEHGRTKAAEPPSEREAANDDFEDQRLQKIFNETFADESTLVRETFKEDADIDVGADEPTVAIPKPTRSSRHENAGWENKAAPLWESNDVRTSPTPAAPPSKSPGDADLWRTPSAPSHANSVHSPAPSPSSSGGHRGNYSDHQVEEAVSGRALDEALDRVLSRIVPPIVERLVHERLDQLLKEQEQYLEIKP